MLRYLPPKKPDRAEQRTKNRREKPKAPDTMSHIPVTLNPTTAGYSQEDEHGAVRREKEMMDYMELFNALKECNDYDYDECDDYDEDYDYDECDDYDEDEYEDDWRPSRYDW